jgi:hypothetical protein
MPSCRSRKELAVIDLGDRLMQQRPRSSWPICPSVSGSPSQCRGSRCMARTGCVRSARQIGRRRQAYILAPACRSRATSPWTGGPACDNARASTGGSAARWYYRGTNQGWQAIVSTTAAGWRTGRRRRAGVCDRIVREPRSAQITLRSYVDGRRRNSDQQCGQRLRRAPRLWRGARRCGAPCPEPSRAHGVLRAPPPVQGQPSRSRARAALSNRSAASVDRPRRGPSTVDATAPPCGTGDERARAGHNPMRPWTPTPPAPYHHAR